MTKTSRRFFLLVAVVVFTSPVVFAARVERLIDTWQPKNYVVSLTLNDQLSEIVTGRARIDVLVLKKTALIDLDFGELKTTSVTVDSKPAPFTHRNGKLEVTLAEAVTPGSRIVIEVVYQGKPKDGLIMKADKDGKPSAVGDNWPNRVHHWIPTLDHPSAKATVTFNVTAPAREEVVANGRLENVQTTAGGNRTWTYTTGAPIPPYCMIIAVGQFARVEPSERSPTPLSYYVPHSDRPAALKGFAPSIPSLVFFSELVAPYPYEKLAMIVGSTQFGGMENSSAIVFTSTLFTPKPAPKSRRFDIPKGNVALIAHEIAHQWFGDSVTESTWADLWLSEGFATYFAGLFVQRHEGEEAFQEYMKAQAEAVFAYEKKKRTPIFDRDTEDLFELLNANNYQKGAWVLHMLRSSLGDEVFFRGIRDYYHAHKDGAASTEDLRAALEKASGKDLKDFFQRWVYGVGHPKYVVTPEYSARGSEVRVVLRQLQAGDAFPDPVPIRVTTDDGVHELIMKPSGRETVATVKLTNALTRRLLPKFNVQVDPRNTILKEVTLKP
jgi:aminopeptidase N